MTQPILAAQVRDVKGKGAARKLRQRLQMPAIFYGPQAETVMLAVDYPEMERILNLASGENVILDLQIKSEEGTVSKKAMLKEVQIDPVSDAYLHADFYEISMDREIMVNIPVHLVGTPVGVTNGGILQHIRRELSITCLPDKLVDFLELDVTELEIGDSLHLEDIDFPEGITPDEEGHLTVVVVAAPTVEEEVVEEEEELEGEEGEEAGEEGTEEAAEETSTEEK